MTAEDFANALQKLSGLQQPLVAHLLELNPLMKEHEREQAFRAVEEAAAIIST